ncbi:UPF0193 protein EVG1 homolog [Pocillopora damicornis]|uniref:UPF0193 protein EVG1 homolog n=1 Tax=Pocillopora damicornis TaxID=46731 RepID=UPI000F551962|nr:UPF0193 protein EVG1 homolog [Pocillopora damicornis]XP_058968980.1 UPF0193 protein EVG1 homolog [Pocillopora verrucosa]
MASNRQPVAKGGLWSSQSAPVSKETQNLLKVMMEESKLTNFQRRQLQDSMKKGQSLPVACNPTTSRNESRVQLTSASKKPLPKVMNARHLSGGKKTKETIDIQKSVEPQQIYRPAPGKLISEKDKRRLQNVMAYGEHGKDIEDVPTQRRPPPKEMAPEKEVDRFDEILQEIEDRKSFLDEMEALGEGKKYRTIIMTEISQKIRELELIDKERSKELNLAE